MKQAISQSDRC